MGPPVSFPASAAGWPAAPGAGRVPPAAEVLPLPAGITAGGGAPALSGLPRSAGLASGLTAVPDWTAESDQANAWLGSAVATAGDVNDDGYDDLIVGIPGYNPGWGHAGAVAIFYGSATGPGTVPDWRAEADQTGYPLEYDSDPAFGAAVAAGDWNCDGYPDVAVGMPFYNLPDVEVDEGAVFVWYGSAQGLGPNGTLDNADWRAESNQGGGFYDYSWDTMFGRAVGNAGDVNGDGCDDLIVGAPGYDWAEPCAEDHGRVFVWYGGSPDGLGENGTPDNADWKADSGGMAYVHMGYAAGSAGSVNNDDYADVIVGADALGVFVWHGSATGLGPEGDPSNADWKVESYYGYKLGAAAGTAGDVDDDGYDDVIVGAPLYDGQFTDEGQALVYLGSPGGLGASAAWTATGGQSGAQFGFSVGAAGDVNNDSYADVLVGAPFYDNGEANEGQAYAYHGSSAGPSTTPDWTAESDQANALFGYAVATAGNIGGDALADVLVGAPYHDNGQTDEGRAYAYFDTGVPFRVWVEVQPGTVLALTPAGWYTPNPVTYRAHVWSEQALDLQGTLKLDFLVEEVDRGVFLTFVPQTNPGGGQTGPNADCWQVAEQAYCEAPIGGVEHVPALEEHVIVWTVWVQPMAGTTVHGAVDLFPDGDPGRLVHAPAPHVVVPQAQVHPVIIIPGTLGTWPPDPNVMLDPWERVYDPLREYLQQLGYEPGITLFEFPYDWRESVMVTGPLLGDKIAWIKDPQRPGPRPGYVDFTEVDIVGHSMGGLVAQAYLEAGDHSEDVNKLITLATPHRGSPESYLTWEGLEMRNWRWFQAQVFWSEVHQWAGAAGYCFWRSPPFIGSWSCAPAEVHTYIHGEADGLRELLPVTDLPEGGDSTEPNDSGDGVVPAYSAAITTVSGLEGLHTHHEQAPHMDVPRTAAVMSWVVQVLTGVVRPPDPKTWPDVCTLNELWLPLEVCK